MMQSQDTYGSQLPQRRLGRSGLVVPTVGLGGAGIGRGPDLVDDSEAVETVRYTLAQGIT